MDGELDFRSALEERLRVMQITPTRVAQFVVSHVRAYSFSIIILLFISTIDTP